MRIFLNEFIAKYADADSITKQDIKEIKKQGAKVTIGLTKEMKNLRKEVLDEEQTKLFAQAVNNLQERGVNCEFVNYYSPRETIYASRKMSDWINEVKDARVNGRELTPYEKVVKAYDIVSQFVYTHEEKEEGSDVSRNAIRVLTGDKIVCVGYQSLMRHILQGVGVACSELILNPTKGKIGHSVLLIHLDDPKYHKQGYMISDPTWGSRDPENHMGQAFDFVGKSLETEKEEIKYEDLYIDDRDLEIAQKYCLEYATGNYFNVQETEEFNGEMDEIRAIYEESRELTVEMARDHIAEFPGPKFIAELVNENKQSPDKNWVLSLEEQDFILNKLVRCMMTFGSGTTMSSHLIEQLYWAGLKTNKIINELTKRLKSIETMSDDEIISFISKNKLQEAEREFGSVKSISDQDLEKYISLREQMVTHPQFIEDEGYGKGQALYNVATSMFPDDMEDAHMHRLIYTHSRLYGGWTAEEEQLFAKLYKETNLSVQEINKQVTAHFREERKKIRDAKKAEKEKQDETHKEPVIEDYVPEQEENTVNQIDNEQQEVQEGSPEESYEKMTLLKFINRYSDKKNLTDYEIQKIQGLGGKILLIKDAILTDTNTDVLSKDQLSAFADAMDNIRDHGLDCVFKDGEELYSPEEIFDASLKISQWVDEINDAKKEDRSELTPLEKFQYAYDITTQFEYAAAKSEEEWKEAQNLVKVLNGGKTMAVGYSSILRHICRGLNINCAELQFSNDENQSSRLACLVYMQDDKYGVDGYFVSDPTSGRARTTEHKGQNVDAAMMGLEEIRNFCEANNLHVDNFAKAEENLHSPTYYKIQDAEAKKKQLKFLVNAERGITMKQGNYFGDLTRRIDKSFEEYFEKNPDKNVTSSLLKQALLLDKSEVQEELDFVFKHTFLFNCTYTSDAATGGLSDKAIEKLLAQGLSQESITQGFCDRLKAFCNMDAKEKIAYSEQFSKVCLDAEEPTKEELEEYHKEVDKFSKTKFAEVGENTKENSLANMLHARTGEAMARVKYVSRLNGYTAEQETLLGDLLNKHEEGLSFQEIENQVKSLYGLVDEEQDYADKSLQNEEPNPVEEKETEQQDEQEQELAQLPIN